VRRRNHDVRTGVITHNDEYYSVLIKAAETTPDAVAAAAASASSTLPIEEVYRIRELYAHVFMYLCGVHS
jgi:hypothetical protein